MGYDEFTAFDVEQENERLEREEYYRVAGHNDDARDNADCLALAVDFLTTSRALQDAYAEKDTVAWVALSEHMARVRYAVSQWQGLAACIARGDYGV